MLVMSIVSYENCDINYIYNIYMVSYSATSAISYTPSLSAMPLI